MPHEERRRRRCPRGGCVPGVCRCPGGGPGPPARATARTPARPFILQLLLGASGDGAVSGDGESENLISGTEHKYLAPGRSRDSLSDTMVASTLLLLAASLAPLCVRAAVPRDKIHPNSVYSQLPRSKHNKHADMKIFYQTGVCTSYFFLHLSKMLNGINCW